MGKSYSRSRKRNKASRAARARCRRRAEVNGCHAAAEDDADEARDVSIEELCDSDVGEVYGSDASIEVVHGDDGGDEHCDDDGGDNADEESGAESSTANDSSNGKAIVDLQWFVNDLLQKQKLHSETCEGVLQLHDVTIKAFNHMVYLRCAVCGEINKTSTVPDEQEKLLSTAFYIGTFAAGSTFSNASEMLAAFDIKAPNHKTFMSRAAEAEPFLEEIVEDLCADAIQEEAAIAVSKASVDGDGVPCFAVVTDGAWNKRSFGHGYSASSGAAVIIGAETGKVLFIGSRHRRCKACDHGNTDHKCYANWSGPPGQMEGSIIVEGFKACFEKHRVKFTQVIADEDSSVFRKLKEEIPYGPSIEKLNCVNHARKNFKKALLKLEATTSYPTAARKILGTEREAMVNRLRQVLIHSGNQNGSDVPGLVLDIRSILSHCFNNHESCRPVVCPKAGQASSSSQKFDQLRSSALFKPVVDLLEELSRKAHRLRLNLTTNDAESCFSLLNKLNMGKRVDLASRGEMYRRILGVAAAWNNPTWVLTWFQRATDMDPGAHFTSFVDGRAKKREYDNTRVRTKAHKTTHDSAGYGTEADDTLYELVTEQEILDKLTQFEKQQRDVDEIRARTTLQAREQYMNGRIDAHHFADILSSRDSASMLKKLPAIGSLANNADYLLRNIEYLDEGLSWLASRNYEFQKVGLIIDDRLRYVCCCPDGISENGETILFIECVRTKGSTIHEAAVKLAKFPLRLEDGVPELADMGIRRKTQAAMHICQAEKAVLLFVNNSRDMVSIEVVKNAHFWAENATKLQEFSQLFLRYLVAKNIEVK